eukprot:6161803-Lingulodinium_polyedra.AAC.1
MLTFNSNSCTNIIGLSASICNQKGSKRACMLAGQNFMLSNNANGVFSLGSCSKFGVETAKAA